MSPIVGYHASRYACRDSIRRHGLLCSRPAKGQLVGVYVFRPDGSFNHPSRTFDLYWDERYGQDLWECAYIGPLAMDRFVINGMVLLHPVQHVTLVTGNNCADR